MHIFRTATRCNLVSKDSYEFDALLCIQSVAVIAVPVLTWRRSIARDCHYVVGQRTPVPNVGAEIFACFALGFYPENIHSHGYSPPSINLSNSGDRNFDLVSRFCSFATFLASHRPLRCVFIFLIKLFAHLWRGCFRSPESYLIFCTANT